jgi:hypothetical protein
MRFPSLRRCPAAYLFELQATINAAKPLAGYKANAYIIFDYQSPTDFKFSGIDISIDKMVMGHRDAAGWHIDVQVPAQLKPDQDYNILLAVNGTTATVVINNAVTMSYAFAPRVIDGFSFGLNTGMVGIGANNAKGRIDNVTAQILPPAITLNHDEDFNDGVADLFTAAKSGNWELASGRYAAALAAGSDFAVSNFDLSLATSSLLKMEATLNTESFGGLVFDYYNADVFKFAAVVPGSDQVVIGHHTKRGWFIDAAVTKTLTAGTDYNLGVSLEARQPVSLLMVRAHPAMRSMRAWLTDRRDCSREPPAVPSTGF